MKPDQTPRHKIFIRTIDLVQNILLVIICLLTTTSLQSKPVPGSLIRVYCRTNFKDPDQKLTIILANLEHKETRLALQSKNGRIKYSETIKDETSFAKIFDFQQLPSGSYILFVENDVKKIVDVILFESGKFEVYHADNAKNSSKFLECNRTEQNVNLSCQLSRIGRKKIKLSTTNKIDHPIKITLESWEEGTLLKRVLLNPHNHIMVLNLSKLKTAFSYLAISTEQLTILFFFSETSKNVHLISNLYIPRNEVDLDGFQTSASNVNN